MEIENFWSIAHSPKLLRVKKVSKNGVQEWIKSANFTPNADANQIDLAAFDLDDLLCSWASDTSRLLVAARDTLSAIDGIRGKPKSTAWILIKSYYAAFYYAHVMLRLTRCSLTYTPTSQLMRIRGLLDAYGIPEPFPLKTNQYILKYNEIPPRLQVKQKSGGDGTHENTWRQFEAMVFECEAAHEIKCINSAEKGELKSIADKLRRSIYAAENSGKLLSSIRNEVQYTQLHGVWPPYGSTLKSDYCLRRLREVHSKTTNIGDFDLDSGDKATCFLNCCLLICWSAEKFVMFSTKDKPKSFLRSKALA
ncbi:hypothetical protein [Leisingera sp. NJS204]|uniref:hypothetical protein n=1 Tax=Leisingera sp. NJS204 TaxID=2508307 RepID=UPI001011B9D5|nr:hypothetical protein [Leisingera sp. NJS204]QAX28138.1 hypothetical protein ETW24_01200 [Leisingera sp. NJS204]